MRKRLMILIALLAALSLVAAACGSDDDDGDDASSDDSSEEASDDSGEDMEEMASSLITMDEVCENNPQDAAPDGYAAGLITDIGTVSDRTFNQFAYEGMLAAADCYGFETSFIETVSEDDYETNIATMLESDPDIVITVGFLIADATLAAAQENPDVLFVGIDQFHPEFPENYVGVLFREDQAGYLAGTMAGQLTESGVVCVVGGREDVPPVVRLVNSYVTGAQAQDADIEVLTIFNESFTDETKGASDAEQFRGVGCDVTFGAGGLTGSAGVRNSTEDGTWGIGVDQDEFFTTFAGGDAPGAEYLATSAVKRVDVGVFLNIAAALAETFAGGIFTLDVANDGITYAPSHDADVPDEALAEMERVRLGLVDGSIETGVDPITGLPL